MPTTSSTQGYFAPFFTVLYLGSSHRGENGYTSGLSNSDESFLPLVAKENLRKDACHCLSSWKLCGSAGHQR